MATLKQYVTTMQTRQGVVARKLGVDITRADKTVRVLNLSLLTIIAAVVKTLVDKGALTDAELVATLNSARDDVYDDEPIQPQPAEP